MLEIKPSGRRPFTRERGLMPLPTINNDCNPRDIGMPYDVMVNPVRIASAMKKLGFTNDQLFMMQINLKFKPDAESLMGQMSGLSSLGRPLNKAEGYGVEIRIGDMFRELERASVNFDSGYNDRKDRENRFAVLVKRFLGEFIYPSLFPEIIKIKDKHKPKSLGLEEARNLGKVQRGKSPTKAHSGLKRRMGRIFQYNLNYVLAHEVGGHLKLDEEHEEELEESAGEMTATIAGYTAGGAILGLIVSSALSNLAADLHVEPPPDLARCATVILTLVSGGTGLFKGIGVIRDKFAYEDQAYKKGKEFMDLFKGSVILKKIKN